MFFIGQRSFLPIKHSLIVSIAPAANVYASVLFCILIILPIRRMAIGGKRFGTAFAAAALQRAAIAAAAAN